MVRIHPYENYYFSALTDRTTPERLISRYGVHRSYVLKGALGDIIEDYPSGELALAVARPYRIIPRGDLKRFTMTRDFHSDERNFYVFGAFDDSCSAPLYAGRVYASTMHCVVDPVAYFGGYRRAALATEPLNRSRFNAYRLESRMVYVRDGCSPEDMDLRLYLRVHPVNDQDDPANGRGHSFSVASDGVRIDGNCVAVHRLPAFPIARIETDQYTPENAEAARRAMAGVEPRARSRFDVWGRPAGDGLIYVRENCSTEDTARFFLHVYPADTAPTGGFTNLDFEFGVHGIRTEDGACIITAPLPAYSIANIHTGQRDSWAVRFAFSPPEVNVAALAGEPLARAVFDIRVDGDALIYVKDGCTEDDMAAQFSLHVHPVDPDDLPTARREHGFENRDFFLWQHGGRAGERCIAVVPLPAYPVATVHTGQYDENGGRWETRFSLVHGEAASLAGEPLASSEFDIWLEGSALVYVKDECAEEDTAAQFFLHVHPVDAADLPEARREHGFDNRDFLLWQRGGRDAGGRCVAMTALPDYPIASIRTGQYDASGQRWAVEFALPE